MFDNIIVGFVGSDQKRHRFMPFVVEIINEWLKPRIPGRLM
jgi:hypothetical protein